MLVLNRRVGETIRINDDIHCTFLGIKGNQVRLGFSVPKSVSIQREEVYVDKRIRKIANECAMRQLALDNAFAEKLFAFCAQKKKAKEAMH